MKSLKSFLPFIALILIACMIHLLHGPTSLVLAGIPMINANDIRLAYVNAFRNLHNLATNNSAIQPKDAKWYPNRGNVILSQSFLRTEIVLNANKSAYQFGILNNQITNSQSAIFSSEQRLTLQDIFFVSQIGYYLLFANSATGDTSNANTLYTHPPGILYNGTNSIITLNALWQGVLTLNVNNRVVEPGWDLWRHYETPQTQYPVFNSVVTGEQFPVNDENYGSQSGVYPVEPMWILNGAYDNVMNVTYNSSFNNIGLPAAPGFFKMVIILRGILAQNCSKIMEPGIMNPS